MTRASPRSRPPTPVPRARPGCPRLRSDLCLRPFPPDHVLLFGEAGQTVFSDPVYLRLLPLLDGRRDAPALAAMLRAEVSLAEIYYVLDQLEAQKLLRWMPPAEDAAAAAWADAAGLDAQALGAPIDVVALPGCEAQALAGPLRALGLAVATGAAPALTVVMGPDPLAAGFSAINAARLADGRPWLLFSPGGRAAWIGPVFVPGQTACWACWAHRLRECRQAETWLGTLVAGAAPHAPALATPASRAAVEALLVTEVLKAAADPAAAVLAGGLLSYDSLTHETRRHAVRRRPQCPSCGGPPVSHPRIRLSETPQPLGEGDDSSALEALVDPVAGVVHSVETGQLTENALVHTAIARHFFPMFKDDAAVLWKNLQGRAGGKGATARAARTGALGEAVERYSGIWPGDHTPTVRASTQALGATAVTLDALLNVSPSQYAGRTAWNRQLKSPHQVVPAPLAADQAIDWSPAWSLTEDRLRHLPAAYCWYGHPELSRMFCLADSNGCAAASTRERAVMRALLELIERDAVALWWYCRAARPGIDIAAFGDPALDALVARYAALGREVWALDVSTEFGVPVIVALSARAVGREDIVFGFGAGLSAHAALQDALGEMGQSYVHVSDGAAAPCRGENPEMVAWLQTATRRSQPWLCAAPHLPRHGPADMPGVNGRHPSAVVAALVQRLGGAGHEVIALEQTRPDIGIPVMRVVAPGLRHFWRRLGPGRLYTAPVALGWIDAACGEADLNPFSIFI